MLGSSAGIRGVHDAAVLPLDTLTFLLRAEDARKKMGDANGLFFAFDKRLDDPGSDGIVRRRTERLRDLLHRLLPHFAMRTHTDLENSGLASTLERVAPASSIEDAGLRAYCRMQTAQVLLMHEQSRNGSPSRFTKFGWILSRRGNGAPVGGEANFDDLLPADIAIEKMYTAPGFPLDSTNGKAPYLINDADKPVRVCLSNQAADVGDEVLKVKPGITRLAHDTIRATSERILGMRDDVHPPEHELAALPVAKVLKQRIDDPKMIEDLRELLSASLRTLLP